jgi:thiamine pyrophosphokinase
MLESMLTQIYSVKAQAIIIANGQFPSNSYLQQLIKDAPVKICCDGAIHQLLALDILPDYIIGDCDSISPCIKSQLKAKVIQISEQNSNDLTKAVNFAHSLGLTKVIIVGATGLREDHTLANIALLADYATIIEKIAIVSDFGIFTAHSGQAKLKTMPGQQVSLFTLDHKTTLTCKELRWPLDNYHFKSWFQGSLNQAIGYHLELVSNGIVIIFRAFEIKN